MALKTSSTYAGKLDQRGQAMVDWLSDMVTRMARLIFLKSPSLNLTTYDSKDREPVWGAESVSVTTDGAGAATITFPVAFPSALIAVVFSSTALAYVRLNAVSASSFSIVGPLSATFTLHYVAVGV
jgi:hypothetical protein